MLARDAADLASKFLLRSTPFYVQFQLTGRCNLRCRPCCVPQRLQGLAELPIAGIAAVAENLGRIGTTNLVLTGGEPFLRPDLPAIVEVCKRRVPHVRLQTNGLLITEENLAPCVAAGLDGLTISLDSLVPRVEEELTGRPGVLPLILEKIVLINNLFPPRRGPLAVNAILSAATCAGMRDLVGFVEGIGWSIAVVPVHVGCGSGEGFVLRQQQGRDDPGQEYPRQAGALLQDLAARKTRGAAVANSRRYLREAEPFIRTGETRWRQPWRTGWACDSPNLYFAVRPDGSFSVCHDFSFPERVDVADPGFPELFRKPEFRARVKDAAAACPGCYYGCYPEYTWMFRSPRNFFETCWGYAWSLLRPRRRRLELSRVLGCLRAG
ncbi:MAG: radical SAM protein [Elusimicrobia bacterium]|nr:radical SAM protein [Elusimicrobiota bacterium]